MTHPLGVRATSMLASSAVMGLLVLGALSVSYTVQQLHFPPPPGDITIVTEPPAPPPPVPVRTTPPPSEPQTTAEVFTPPDLPPAIMDTSATTGESFTPTPLIITNPHWRQRPRDLERYYPRRAMANNVRGEAVLDCLVDPAGALGCRVVSETPANWGFGEAALRISRDYAMVPATRDGQTVEGRYRMRVPFDLR